MSSSARRFLVSDQGCVGSQAEMDLESEDQIQFQPAGGTMPDVRVDLVSRVRRLIELGVYDTESRLELCVDRMLTDVVTQQQLRRWEQPAAAH
ncbi:MAG: hypothetical protein IT440_00725 [Phycisphaeraceae bacterium]|nr:hypothetical protein [Phycisphaeraceae bacterium]